MLCYGMGRKTNTITGASHLGAKPFIVIWQIQLCYGEETYPIPACETGGSSTAGCSVVSLQTQGCKLGAAHWVLDQLLIR